VFGSREDAFVDFAAEALGGLADGLAQLGIMLDEWPRKNLSVFLLPLCLMDVESLD
jgi:hypothetical protein